MVKRAKPKADPELAFLVKAEVAARALHTMALELLGLTFGAREDYERCQAAKAEKPQKRAA